MTHFFHSSRLAWPPIVLLGLAATAVHAQTAASPAPATTTSPPAVRSVFDGYQPYSDEKTVNWRQANDNTARIGGWRAYAKEAAEPASPAMLPAPATSPAKP